MTRSLRPFALLVLPLLLALALPRPASARDFEPLFIGVGTLKIPGIAFDVVGMVQAGPTLNTTEGSEEFRRALRTSFVANGITLGLHTVSVAAFLGSGFDARQEEESVALSFLVNGACDLGIAVLGLASGIDLLQRRRASGLQGTDLGISAGWSGWVNVVMGGFGAAWFGPMMIGGLLAADEVVDELPEEAPPGPSIRIAPMPSGILVTGTF